MTAAASPSATGLPPIRFGTDGWRAEIADAFTYPQVKRVAQASARILTQTYAGNGIAVGYDNRFLSEHFARAAAEAIAAIGIPVKLSSQATPTPALSWTVHQLGLQGALVVTASHNPPEYSGIKLKGAFGGSVSADITRQVEELLADLPVAVESTAPVAIEDFDPWPMYLGQLSQQVDLDAIRQSSVKIWIDAMHGSAAGGMTRLLGDRVREIRGDRDPLFGGMSPEPLPPQLATTMEAIAADPAPLKVGLVFDGDGDRIAAIDGKGKFLSPQIAIPILIQHLAERRGYSGELVKTVSGSELFAKVAALYDIPVTETPIGFKYLADRMLATDVLLGGEESGGIGFTGHIPERDGMLSALYLLEAIAATERDLSDLYRDLQERTGYTSYYNRRDLHLPDKSKQEKLMRSLDETPPQAIEGRQVQAHLTQDGHKFVLEDGSWLMIRASGTEPVLRLYCEALSPEAVEALLDWAENWANRA
ncbi:phosphoglucomutase/phosphomannomutase family protein [Synechococcus sp. PCC 7336]|uniref:phosphoglucomutase/phosphomannomutase family protein n=1 Tax=Synechococcus sp. PCC 7336 TaxID=195250 RepID=UPI000344965C|nr:phosphoglucomutase/phosphomannomutase family protein [Synechococcus sp. PCC 7336]